jgi:ribosome-binding protein aMBF1 (putative translation factor)
MSDGHPLRKWRNEQTPKVSQEALGVRLDVDAMTVSRWENGETEPQKRQWDKIEEVTGITRQQFLGFDKEVAA